MIRRDLSWSLCLVVRALLISPLPASEEQTPPAGAPTEVLTLARALGIAERNSPQLRAGIARIDRSRAGITTARAYPNPEFNFFGGNQFARANPFGPGAPGLLQHYSAGQAVELPSVRETRLRVAELGETSSEAALEEVRLAVRGALKQAFYQVLRRREEVDIALENLRLVEDLRRRIQVQVNVGEAARLELVRSEAEVATSRTLLRSSQLRLVTALAGLRMILGEPMGTNLDPRGTLDPPVTLPPLEVLRERILQRHPSILRARLEVDRAEARIHAEMALRKPQPYFRAEFENQPDLRFFRFGFSIPVPLINRRRGPVAEAAAALVEARAIASARQLELFGALEQSRGQYEVASQQLASYRDGVLREAEAALEAAEAAFRFGERGIIEVLDAQRVLRSVRADFLNAQYDLQEALVNLEQLRAIDIGGTP